MCNFWFCTWCLVSEPWEASFIGRCLFVFYWCRLEVKCLKASWCNLFFPSTHPPVTSSWSQKWICTDMLVWESQVVVRVWGCMRAHMCVCVSPAYWTFRHPFSNTCEAYWWDILPFELANWLHCCSWPAVRQLAKFCLGCLSICNGSFWQASHFPAVARRLTSLFKTAPYIQPCDTSRQTCSRWLSFGTSAIYSARQLTAKFDMRKPS